MNINELVQNIRAVVDYNWKDERNDYAENYPDNRDGHIFCALVALDNFLLGENNTPESYIEIEPAEVRS